jgi:hypothetical protein
VLKTISMLALALAFTALPANAATITYNVDQTIALGSVIGTIETDGALGVLSQSDITGFSLQVSGPGASVLLTQADSVVRTVGNNLTATASDLLFDYSGPSGYLLFQFGTFGTGMQYYCNASVAGTCFQGASAIPESFNSPSAQVEIRAGNQIIASVAGAVPEPTSWALMLGGFGVIGAAMRRKPVVTFLPG